MSRVSACSVSRQCGVRATSGPVCGWLPLLAAACATMPDVPACTDFMSVCSQGKCAPYRADSALALMPSHEKAYAAVASICGSMPMDACADCTADSAARCRDPLLTLSALCSAMPGMEACAPHRAMCAAADASALRPFCGGAADSMAMPPMMRSYFHTGIGDYLLLKEWVPRSNGAYALACVCVVLGGVLSTALKGVRLALEQQWLRRQGWPARGGHARLYTNACRAALVVSTTGIDYLLMLLAMRRGSQNTPVGIHMRL